LRVEQYNDLLGELDPDVIDGGPIAVAPIIAVAELLPLPVHAQIEATVAAELVL